MICKNQESFWVLFCELQSVTDFKSGFETCNWFDLSESETFIKISSPLPIQVNLNKLDACTGII